jgi:hypothetical protein
LGYLAYAYAQAGRREEAEKLMAEGPMLYQTGVVRSNSR